MNDQPRVEQGNLWSFVLPKAHEAEAVTQILPPGAVQIERIISTGQISPPGFWYEQAADEWVVLLTGTAVLGWDDGTELRLQTGDWVLIPRGKRHRVAYTSQEPPCVWLAVHGELR